jgi:tetratricopeptide (TPR) repeat protein
MASGLPQTSFWYNVFLTLAASPFRLVIIASGLVLIAAAQTPPTPRGALPSGRKPLANPGKTYAVLIGISRYLHDPPVPSLQFADRDAATLAALLQEPRGGKLKIPDQIQLLTNERATRAAIDDAVRGFTAAGAGSNDTLILFVAGHGVYLKTEEEPVTHRVIEREPFILTYESNTQDPNTTGYAMDEFRQMISEQAQHFGRVFVFVDVCHAGNVAGIAGGGELQEAVERVLEGRAGALGLLMAAHAHKFAYESPSFGGGHGAFSYFLISGMNGAAAPAGSYSISFGDLQTYVSAKVPEFTHGKQRPDHFSTDDDIEVIANTREEGIKLDPAQPLGDNDLRDARRRRGAPGANGNAPEGDNDDPFTRAVHQGLLLPEQPGSAWNMLAQLRGDPSLGARQRQLRVALEDRGQELISRYLEGEQVPQKKSDFDLCARYFTQALNLAPDATFDRSRSLFCQGRSLIFESRYDQARRLLEDSIHADPRRAYAYNALGIAYLENVARAGQGFDDARTAFLSAIRFAPYWAYPLHNLALLESERGNYQEAIRLYQQAMLVGPRYSYLPYNLGLLYERLGDLDNARKWLEKAREIYELSQPNAPAPSPQRAEIWNALGTVLRSQGRTAKAIDSFNRALGDDPDSENARQNLGSLRYQLGETAAAGQLWRENLDRHPAFLPSRMSYADSLARSGRNEAAIEQYEAAVLQKPDLAAAHEALARLYLAQNQIDSALKHVQIPPASAPMLELLGDIRQRMGQSDQAVDAWKKALALTTNRAVRKRIESKLRSR